MVKGGTRGHAPPRHGLSRTPDYERNPQGVLSALLREVLLNRRPIVPTCQLETVQANRATAWTCRPRRDEEIDQHLLASISNIEHGPLS